MTRLAEVDGGLVQVGKEDWAVAWPVLATPAVRVVPVVCPAESFQRTE
jgi:hypothetical protein